MIILLFRIFKTFWISYLIFFLLIITKCLLSPSPFTLFKYSIYALVVNVSRVLMFVINTNHTYKQLSISLPSHKFPFLFLSISLCPSLILITNNSFSSRKKKINNKQSLFVCKYSCIIYLMDKFLGNIKQI